MPIQDGNPPAQETKVTATVDPNAVAQIVRQMQLQDQAQQKKESRFEAKIKSLLSTEKVDKENLAEITALTQAAVDDLKDELKNKSGESTIQTTQSRYAEAVADALEKYIEGDDQLEETAELLQHKVLKKLAANSEVMAKFNSNQLDKRQISATAKEVVEEFSKKVLKRDKVSKGPAINSQVTGSVASNAIENSPPAGSIDDIVEPHRREAYSKLKSLLTRARVAPEEAHKRAYAMATKQYKRSGSAA